jgi:hypothetical protein
LLCSTFGHREVFLKFTDPRLAVNEIGTAGDVCANPHAVTIIYNIWSGLCLRCTASGDGRG